MRNRLFGNIARRHHIESVIGSEAYSMLVKSRWRCRIPTPLGNGHDQELPCHRHQTKARCDG